MPYEPKVLYKGLLKQNETIFGYTPTNKAVVKQISLTQLKGDNPKLSLGISNKNKPFGIRGHYSFASKNMGTDSIYIPMDDEMNKNSINIKKIGSAFYGKTDSYINIQNGALIDREGDFNKPPIGVTVRVENNASLSAGEIDSTSTSYGYAYFTIDKPIEDFDIENYDGIVANIEVRKRITSDANPYFTIYYKDKNGAWANFDNTPGKYAGGTSMEYWLPSITKDTLKNKIDTTKPLEIKIRFNNYGRIYGFAMDYKIYKFEIISPPIDIKGIGDIGKDKQISFGGSIASGTKIQSGITKKIALAKDGLNYNDFESELPDLDGVDLNIARFKLKIIGYTDKTYTFENMNEFPLVSSSGSIAAYISATPSLDCLIGSVLYDYKPTSSSEIIDVSIPMTNNDSIKLAGFISESYKTQNINVTITGYEY